MKDNNEIYSQLTKEEREILGVKEEQEKSIDSNIANQNESVNAAREKMLNSFNDENNSILEQEKPSKHIKTESTKNNSNEQKNLSPSDVLDLLKNMDIDINNIHYTEKEPMDRFKETQFYLNGRSTFETVCPQSAYIAHLEGLSLQDLNSFENSTGDVYTEKSRLFSTIYSKIHTTSIGKPSYEEWLKMTSIEDVENFCFGIYNQSFKDETDFRITCSNCGFQFNIKLNNKNLMVMNEEVANKIKETLKNAHTVKEVKNNSVLGKIEKVILDDSKLLIHIRIPSLYDYLQILSSIDRNNKETLNSIGLYVYIDKIFRVDIAEFTRTRKINYYPLETKEEMLRELQRLNLNDSAQLGNEINKLTEKNSIGFGVKSCDCPKCKNKIGKIPVDMESLLFFQIAKM